MQVTNDPRFTHWIERPQGDGEKGQGQYWFTNADDARSYAAALNKVNPRWKYAAYERNPLYGQEGQQRGVVLMEAAT